MPKIRQKACKLNTIYKDNVISGYNTYSNIISTYGLQTKIKLLYTGTGDAYIAAAHYINYIDYLCEKDCALLVVGSNSVKKIFELFGIGNAYVLTQRQIFELIKLYVFFGEKISIELLHPHLFFRHTGFMAYLEGIHPGMNFAEVMKDITFEKVRNCPVKPSFVFDMSYIRNLEQEGLEKSNTVILIPESTTIKPLPIAFWKELTDALKKNGFEVFINEESTQKSEALEVKRLFLPYKYIVPVLNYYCCHVVGMRCGLFDIIESSNCYKYILYNAGDKRGCAKTANLLKSFSVKEMYGDDTANEYLVDEANVAEVMGTIVDQIYHKRQLSENT